MLNELDELVRSVPWYIWPFVILLLINILNRKEWSFSVTFDEKKGMGGGDIDIWKYRATSAMIEIDIDLHKKFFYQPVEVFINGVCVLKVEKDEYGGKNGGNIYYKTHYEYEIPTQGSSVAVVVNGEKILRGYLKPD